MAEGLGQKRAVGSSKLTTSWEVMQGCLEAHRRNLILERSWVTLDSHPASVTC